MISGLLENQINVYDMDVSPTPIIFRESKKFDGAIIVTASHNPLNGMVSNLFLKEEDYLKMN